MCSYNYFANLLTFPWRKMSLRNCTCTGVSLLDSSVFVFWHAGPPSGTTLIALLIAAAADDYYLRQGGYVFIWV